MPTKLEARVDAHDRQIIAIRKLLMAGMKMLNETQELAKENQVLIKQLAASQKETDRMLNRLIRSLERSGGNGHTKTNIQ